MLYEASRTEYRNVGEGTCQTCAGNSYVLLSTPKGAGSFPCPACSANICLTCFRMTNEYSPDSCPVVAALNETVSKSTVIDGVKFALAILECPDYLSAEGVPPAMEDTVR